MYSNTMEKLMMLNMQGISCISDQLLGHGYGWSPVNLEVMVGDTVEWCWEGPVPTVRVYSHQSKVGENPKKIKGT